MEDTDLSPLWGSISSKRISGLSEPINPCPEVEIGKPKATHPGIREFQERLFPLSPGRRGQGKGEEFHMPSVHELAKSPPVPSALGAGDQLRTGYAGIGECVGDGNGRFGERTTEHAGQ